MNYVGLFFLLILLAFIYKIYSRSRHYRISLMIRSFEREVSEEKVKKLIKLIRKTHLENHPSTWNMFRGGFFLVNNSKEINSSLKEELMNILLTRGCNLGNVRIIKSANEIQEEFAERERQNEVKRRETGANGEKDIQHNLSFLTMQGYRILNNVKISNSIYAQEIDHIVIGTNGLFHIETKNHDGYGKIIIDKGGNWIKEEGGRQFAIKNPLAQVDRHDMAIKEYLNKEFPNINIPVVPIIAHANESYIIEGQENFPIPVLKSEQLTYFIKNYKAENTLSNELIEEIYLKVSGQKVKYA